MRLAAADLIPGTDLDDWLVALVGILVAVTTLAALAHKPPLAQIGHFVGWITRRLVGDPIAGWLDTVTEQKVRPIVREEVEAAVEPIREEQRAVAEDLRTHMAAETRERAELLAVVDEHVQEDRAAFEEIKDWRARADLALRNIQQAQHPPPAVE